MIAALFWADAGAPDRYQPVPEPSPAVLVPVRLTPGPQLLRDLLIRGPQMVPVDQIAGLAR